jgi:hypothetical protein
MTDRWNIPSANIGNKYRSQKMSKCSVHKRFAIILSTTTIVQNVLNISNIRHFFECLTES